MCALVCPGMAWFGSRVVAESLLARPSLLLKVAARVRHLHILRRMFPARSQGLLMVEMEVLGLDQFPAQAADALVTGINGLPIRDPDTSEALAQPPPIIRSALHRPPAALKVQNPQTQPIRVRPHETAPLRGSEHHYVHSLHSTSGYPWLPVKVKAEPRLEEKGSGGPLVQGQVLLVRQAQGLFHFPSSTPVGHFGQGPDHEIVRRGTDPWTA